MRYTYLCLLSVLVTSCAILSPDVERQEIRNEMHTLFSAFVDLQPYLYEKDAFADPVHAEEIQQLIATLSSGFHKVEGPGARFTDEPGFVSTLKIVNELLEDSAKRFSEGNVEYAHWRLKTTSQYCISCHTRYEVPQDFGGESSRIKELPNFSRAEFYFATRQFERASEVFLLAVQSPSEGHLRIDALRRWIIIEARVRPHPRETIKTLQRLSRTIHFNPLEQREIADWIRSLKRWQAERSSSKSPLKIAAELIHRSTRSTARFSSESGSVELLRATSMVHKLLDQRGSSSLKPKDRAEALYLLGLAYTRLPFYFVTELPELFLEQCIRDYPGSISAKRSYGLYEESVTLGFTGSGGTRIPEDVQKKLDELRWLAGEQGNSAEVLLNSR